MNFDKILRYSMPPMELGATFLFGYLGIKYNNVACALFGVLTYTHFIDGFSTRKIEKLDTQIKNLESKLKDISK